MSRLVRFFVFLTLLIFILLSFLIYFFLYLEDFSKSTANIEIEKGKGVRQIGSELMDAGVIRSKNLFFLSVFIKRAQDRLRAGEYEFQASTTLDEIVEKLIKGEVKLRKVTIPEGKNIYEISSILNEAGIVNKKEFIELVVDTNFASSLIGRNIKTLEGYLFPDTYLFPKGVKTKEVVVAMADNFKTVYSSIKKNPGFQKLSDHEIVTLASMIEKETGYNSEREVISAVFHNRLKKGMRLECDPTVIYGIGPNFNGNITKKDLDTPTPYNTYKIFGLPPGPIANPGKDSVYAALNPSNVDYLFFVSKGDGTHIFSKDYKSHIDAVNKYIRKWKSKN